MKDFGIGTDIEEIGRFRDLDLSKNRPFLNKIFTDKELAYCFSKAKTAPHLAVRYAGKEAVVKALCNINEQVVNYKDIEVVNNSIGAPEVIIKDKKFRNFKVYISLSHTKEVAIAFAIVTKTKSRM